MISLSDTIKITFKDLKKSKFRTFLTVLGMIIGVASIIIIMSAGKGAESLVTNQIESVGTNLIAVMPGATDEESGPPAAVMGIIVTTLTYDNIKEIKNNIPEVVSACGYVRSAIKATHMSETTDTNYVGVTEDYLDVENVEDKIAKGRFFDERESESIVKIAVLGSKVSEELFRGQDPVGKTIKMKKNSFRVIGVFEERGTEGFLNQDNQIFIPLKTAQKVLMGVNHITFARLKIEDGYNLKTTSEKITQILRDEHDLKLGEPNDFMVQEQETALELLGTVTGAISLFLAAIGAIALLVGGIGIMNIMLAAVNQRIKEIGLRKAVGAKSKDIRNQYLIESAILSLLGAIIGVIIGIVVSYAIAIIARYLDYKWDFVITYSSVIVSCTVSITIGIIFGLYPAQKAAKLNPIEALRYE